MRSSVMRMDHMRHLARESQRRYPDLVGLKPLPLAKLEQRTIGPRQEQLVMPPLPQSSHQPDDLPLAAPQLSPGIQVKNR